MSISKRPDLGDAIKTVPDLIFPPYLSGKPELAELIRSVNDNVKEHYRQVAIAHITLHGQNEKIDLELKLQAKVLRIHSWTILTLSIGVLLLGLTAFGV